MFLVVFFPFWGEYMPMWLFYNDSKLKCTDWQMRDELFENLFLCFYNVRVLVGYLARQ